MEIVKGYITITDISDGEQYFIELSQENVVIPSNSTYGQLANCTATFWKKTGNGAKTAASMYCWVYARKGVSLTLISSASNLSQANSSHTFSVNSDYLTTSYDAIVVYIYPTQGGFNPNTQYYAKKEIAITKNGDKGNKGDDGVAYALTCSPAAVNFRRNAAGEFATAYINVSCEVKKSVGGTISDVTPGSGSGVYLFYRKLTTGSAQAWTQRTSASASQSVSYAEASAATYAVTGLEYALTSNSSTPNNANVLARTTVPVMLDGMNGDPGSTGKAFYSAGQWNDQTKYTANEYECPLVWIDAGSGGREWYYLPEGESTNQNPSQAGTPGNPWKRAQNNWNVILTEALFADFASFQSAVITGDWLISKHGFCEGGVVDDERATYLDGGVAKPYYLKFDPTDPKGETTTNFKPNFALDLKTGALYGSKMDISGTIHAENFFHRICFFDGVNYSNPIYRRTSEVVDYGDRFTEGEYYTKQEIESISDNQLHGGIGFVMSTGPSDIVVSFFTEDNKDNKPSYRNHVNLPDPDKYEGKVVRLFSYGLGSYSGDYEAWTDDGSSKIAGAADHIYADGTIGVPYANSRFPIPIGGSVEFVSAKLYGEDKHVWLLLENRSGGDIHIDGGGVIPSSGVSSVAGLTGSISDTSLVNAIHDALTNAGFKTTDNNNTYRLTLNGTQKGTTGGADLGSFYAPTAIGSDGQFLKSTGSGAPSWSALPTATTSAAGIVQLGTGAAQAAKGDHTHSQYALTSALDAYQPLISDLASYVKVRSLSDGDGKNAPFNDILKNQTGSFLFTGGNLIDAHYDWVGIQVASDYDLGQLVWSDGTLMVRQNDTARTASTFANGWSAWATVLTNRNFASYLNSQYLLANGMYTENNGISDFSVNFPQNDNHDSNMDVDFQGGASYNFDADVFINNKEVATQSWVSQNYALKSELHTHSNKAVLDSITEAMVTKLNGIEAGANKYTHPTNGANTTIAAADGRVLSAITVNNLGHVTSVSYKALSNSDIPSTLTLNALTVSGAIGGSSADFDSLTTENATVTDNLTVKGGGLLLTYPFTKVNGDAQTTPAFKTYWRKIGSYTFTGFGSSQAIIELFSGDGYNGNASQNSNAKITLKHGWQDPNSSGNRVAENSVGVICERYGYPCEFQVRVEATGYTTGHVWILVPVGYGNGFYRVSGHGMTWTHNTAAADTTTDPTHNQRAVTYYDYQKKLTFVNTKNNETVDGNSNSFSAICFPFTKSVDGRITLDLSGISANVPAATTSVAGIVKLGTTEGTAAQGNHTHSELHTHSNKSVLDGITADSISHWNAAYGYSSSIQDIEGWAVSGIAVGTGTYANQIVWYKGNDPTDNGYANYITVPYATAAGKLSTSRTLWGQSFDGSGNVNGKLSLDLTTLGNTVLGQQYHLIEARYKNAAGINFGYAGILSLVGSGETDVAYNMGVRIGSQSGMTWISAGESAQTLSGVLTDMCNNEDVYVTADGGIHFITGIPNTSKDSNGNPSYVRAVDILSNGKVGIGTASPAYKLDVNGSARVSGDLYVGSTKVSLEGHTHSNYQNKLSFVDTKNNNGTVDGNTIGAIAFPFTKSVDGKLTLDLSGISTYSLPTASTTVLGGVKVGDTLSISSGVLNQKSGIATAGTYTKVTVDTYGRVTAGTTLAGSDIPNISATKIAFDKLDAARLPDLSGTYVTLSTTQEITGAKTFTQDVTVSKPSNGGTFAIAGSAYKIGLHIGSGGTNRGIYDFTSGVNNWLMYFDAANTILNYGTVYISGKTDLTSNTPTQLVFQTVRTDDSNRTYNGAYIRVYDDRDSGSSSANGATMVIRGGSDMIIGGGESPQGLYDELLAKAKADTPTYYMTSENLYLVADGNVYIEANANTVANRKGVMLTSGHALIPVLAGTATSKTGSLGNAATLWSSAYIDSVFIGTSISATDGNGLLAYKPASGWSGIGNSQWGVGAVNVQGVIRSNASDLVHYRGGTSYKIWDGFNLKGVKVGNTTYEPVLSGDNAGWVDISDEFSGFANGKVSKSGDSMSGNLTMGADTLVAFRKDSTTNAGTIGHGAFKPSGASSNTDGIVISGSVNFTNDGLPPYVDGVPLATRSWVESGYVTLGTSQQITGAKTFTAAIAPNGGITPIGSGTDSGQTNTRVNTASGNNMLWIKRASRTTDGTPNNGVVLEYGGSDTWTGQLYMGDNATQGLYWNGWSDGERGEWKKIAFVTDTVANATNADTVDGKHASDFLLKTGGVITGTIRMKMDSDASNAKSAVSWINTQESTIGEIQFHNTAKRMIFNASGATELWNDAVNKYSFIVGENELTYNTYKIWHAGNDGSGSGLDADLLDGQHGSYYATKSALDALSNTVSDNHSNSVTNIGTSGNYLTWTDGENSTKNITIPYATNAAKLEGWTKSQIQKTSYVTSGTAGLSSYWCKAWDIIVTNERYSDKDVVVLVSSAFNYLWGIIAIKVRQNGANGSGAYQFETALRLITGNIPADRFRLYYSNTTGKCELWCNVSAQWGNFNFTVLKKIGNRVDVDSADVGTWYNTNFTAVQEFPASSNGFAYIEMSYLPIMGSINTSGAISIDRSDAGVTAKGTQYGLVKARMKNSGTGTYSYNDVISLVGAGETGTTVNNLGVRLGSQSGMTWISAGENGQAFSSAVSDICNTENMYLTADGGIYFYTGVQNNGTGGKRTLLLNSDGSIDAVGNIKITKDDGNFRVSSPSANEEYMFGASSSGYIYGSVNGRYLTFKDGNVGIGTGAPAYKLDVNGTTNLKGAATVSAAEAGRASLTVDGTGTFNTSVVVGSASSAGSLAVNGAVTLGRSGQTDSIVINGYDVLFNARSVNIDDGSGSKRLLTNADLSTYLPLSGGTLTGNVTFNGTGKGLWAQDGTGTYAMFYHNGTNLWIGAEASAKYHHKGATYISAGWSGSAGNPTIYVSVPTTNSTTATNTYNNYAVLHAGNYTSYLTGYQSKLHFYNTKNSNTEAQFSNLYLPLANVSRGNAELDLSAAYNTFGRGINATNSSNEYIRVATVTLAATGLSLASFTAIVSPTDFAEKTTFVLHFFIRRESTDATPVYELTLTPMGTVLPPMMYIRQSSSTTYYVYIKKVPNVWRDYYKITPLYSVGNISLESAGVASMSGNGGIDASYGGIASGLTLNNSVGIKAKNTSGAENEVLTLNSSNNLVIGWGVRSTSNTFITGKTVQLSNNGGAGIILNENGNVGIGTTSPSYKLDVNGSARVSGNLTVTGTLGGPSAAFDTLTVGGTSVSLEGHTHSQYLTSGDLPSASVYWADYAGSANSAYSATTADSATSAAKADALKATTINYWSGQNSVEYRLIGQKLLYKTNGKQRGWMTLSIGSRHNGAQMVSIIYGCEQESANFNLANAFCEIEQHGTLENSTADDVLYCHVLADSSNNLQFSFFWRHRDNSPVDIRVIASGGNAVFTPQAYSGTSQNFTESQLSSLISSYGALFAKGQRRIGVLTSYLKSTKSGLGSNGYWGKIWDIALPKSTTAMRKEMVFMVSDPDTGYSGVCILRLKHSYNTTSNKYTFPSVVLEQVYGNVPMAQFRVYYSLVNGKVELWCNLTAYTKYFNFTVLKQTADGAGDDAAVLGFWYPTDIQTAQTLPTVVTNSLAMVEMTRKSVDVAASSLTIAGSIKAQFSAGTLSFSRVNPNDASPVYSFDGQVTTGSDSRLKTIDKYLEPSVYDIAFAPLVAFRWKNGDSRQNVGTIAQYWEKILPQAVHENSDGFLSLEYSTIALAAGVTASRKAVDNERRIIDLERELTALRARVAELEQEEIEN